MNTQEGISRLQIKIMPYVSMLLELIAWKFCDVTSVAGIVLHTIGALAAPLYCFLIVEGYLHTKKLSLYFLRLGVLAVLSQILYSLCHSENPFALNGVYACFICLLSVFLFDKIKNLPGRIVVLSIILVFAALGEMPIYGMLYALFMFRYHEEKGKRSIGMVVTAVFTGALLFLLNGGVMQALMQIAAILSIPIVLQYNENKGEISQKLQWCFYALYPLTLGVVFIIDRFV